nr:serine/threonine-protein kinase [Planosporangium flavigriseum]
MSVVWRAYDEVLNRPVAIKVLAAKLAADQHSREMIRAEAQAAARLSHPHITNVYDYGESTTRDGDTVPYVVMELISGRTLSERLIGGPLPWRAALRVGAEVAAALAAAHARGLVHRDVKPGNVMLTSSGVKVVDFGIAAIAGETGEPGPEGIVLGTPAYLAPERLAGGPVQPATDVYGLGLLLYRMLTGELPWAAETTTQMINAHVYAEPGPLPPITGLPEGIAELCARCLAKDPADRPTSREVTQALAAAAGTRVPLPIGKDDPDYLGLDPMLFAHSPLAGRPPGRLRLAVAALFGSGVDASADTSILPASIIGSAAIRSLGRFRRRRAFQVVGATAGLATAGLMLTTCADLPHGQGTPLAIAGQSGVSRAPCVVRYVTRSDDASTFNVEVTVTNSGASRLDRWALQFTFTGDQTLREGSAGEWSQSPTGVVTVRGPASEPSLAVGATRTLSFSAGYHAANPLPTEFALNGAACSYVLVGAAGETRTGGPGASPNTASDVEAAGADPAAVGDAAGGARRNGAGAGAPVGGPPVDGLNAVPAATAGGGSTGGGSTGGGADPGHPSVQPSPTGGGASPSAPAEVPSTPSAQPSSTGPPSPTPGPELSQGGTSPEPNHS